MASKFVLLATVACSSVPALGQSQAGRSSAFGGRGFLTPDQVNSIDASGFNFDLKLNDRATTTPVPILRFVDKQNPDGSYTYGFENGDGTYKLETRYETGEVKGKYGYYDDAGQLREVEYGATPNRGFEPVIEGLVVAPPTLVDETVTEAPAPAPAVEDRRAGIPTGGRGFLLPENENVRSSGSASSSGRFANFAPRAGGSGGARRVVVRRRKQPSQPAAQAAVPAAAAPRIVTPAQPAAPVVVDPNQFYGHPAQNIDLNTGAYSFAYGKK